METLKISKNIGKLHQALGKRLYADEYSFLSEICQNAVDSHRMAGQKEPVRVAIESKNGAYWLIVEDKGLSFKDKEDFVDKICTIMESGKSSEKNNDEDCPMGQHGIGSISVSKYRNKWYYEVHNDGRKFNATLQETEGVGLQYELSEYSKVPEGKSVIFSVRVGTITEVGQLLTAINRKLCYFKDIYFDIKDPAILRSFPTVLTLNANFKIYDAGKFQISTISPNNEMHISLDQYNYPIRWSDIGMTPVYTNIGLKFGMGDGLEPDITRENLNITPAYKTLLRQRIIHVCDFFVEKYNDTVGEYVETFADYLKFSNSRKTLAYADRIWDMAPFCHSAIPIKAPVFKGVSKNIMDRFINLYADGRNILNKSFSISNSGSKVTKGIWFSTVRKTDSIFIDEDITPLKLRYLKENYKGYSFFKKKPWSLFPKQGSLCYIHMLHLKGSRKDTWRSKIVEYQTIENAFIKENMLLCSEIKVPENYGKIAKAKSKRRTANIQDLESEMVLSFAKKRYYVDCSFVDRGMKLKDMMKTPNLHIYGTRDDKRRLEMVFYLSDEKKQFSCIVSETNRKNIEKLKLLNFMSVDEFFCARNRVFIKKATSSIIHKLIINKREHFNSKEIIKMISKDLYDKIKVLESYVSKNPTQMHNIDVESAFSIHKLLISQNMFDKEIWGTYKEVKNTLKKFDFMQILYPTIEAGIKYGKTSKQYLNPANMSLQVAVDTLKYRKVKLNKDLYGRKKLSL